MAPKAKPAKKAARKKPAAAKPAAAKPAPQGEDQLLRWALAHVCKAKIDAGEVVGGHVELARAAGGEGQDASLRVHASRLMTGTVQWPDRSWESLARCLGYTRAGLLHAVAAKVVELEAQPDPGPPELTRGRPRKKSSDG